MKQAGVVAKGGGEMALYKNFANKIYSELGYRATWLPGTALALGDVGRLENGVLHVETSLDRLGIPFEAVEDSLPEGSMDFQSRNSVNVVLKAAGSIDGRFKALTQAEAGALVEFSDDDAVLMELKGVTSLRIADQASLKRSLLAAVVAADDQLRWDRDWIVVTDLVRAATATILISGGSSSRVEFRATANITPANLADVSAGLSAASSENVSTRIVAEQGLVPLYRALRVKQNFWWLYDEVVTASGESPDPDQLFDGADPAEDL